MDRNIQIEGACEADIAALANMAGKLFALEPDFHADVLRQERGFRALLAACDRAVVFVARSVKEREPVGMLSCQLVISTAEGGYSGLLEDLYVSPPFRARGIASGLVAAAEAWCGERGATRIQLLADFGNESGLAFWSRVAYEETRMVCRRKILGREPD